MGSSLNLRFVTNHRRKVIEIAHVIPEVKQEFFEFSELQSLDQRAIAKHKLDQLTEAFSEQNVMVDETGLYLDALGRFPGPFVKWMLASGSPQNLYDIASRLGNTKATAKTCLGLMLADGSQAFFVAEMRGRLVPESVEKGYGWDSIFMPDGFDMTFAEMGVENKRMISMRSDAADRLNKYIERRHKSIMS